MESIPFLELRIKDTWPIEKTHPRRVRRDVISRAADARFTFLTRFPQKGNFVGVEKVPRSGKKIGFHNGECLEIFTLCAT